MELSAEQLEALRLIDACTVANAIETFGERLRNEGFADASVRCLFPHMETTVGYAATIKVRGSAPPTANGSYPDRTDVWDYILSVPSPRVVVVQDMATKIGLGSLVGAAHMNIFRALGCVGAVTNGSVRDLPAAESLGFQLFAGGPDQDVAPVIAVGEAPYGRAENVFLPARRASQKPTSPQGVRQPASTAVVDPE